VMKSAIRSTEPALSETLPSDQRERSRRTDAVRRTQESEVGKPGGATSMAE